MTDNTLPLVTGTRNGQVQTGFSDATLGCGFKLNVESGENPFKAKVFKIGQVQRYKKVESKGFCEVMDSLEKVNEHLNIAGHLGVSYGPMISGEGAGEYLKSSTTSKRKSTLHYRSQQVHSFSHFDGNEKLELTDGLDKVWDAETFNTHGTMFVKQIIWGAQLDVTFSVESEEDEDLSDLMAELKGTIGVGPIGIDFKAKFAQRNESSSRKYKMSIKAAATGVSVPIPPNPSLEDVMVIIENFNEGYKALCAKEEILSPNDQSVMTPLAFVLGRTQDFVRKPNELELSYLNQKMKKVSEAFISASYWKERLSAAVCECNSLYTTAHERNTISHTYLLKVNEEIENLERRQEECLAYRQLPLNKVLGWGVEEPAQSPTIYPRSEEEMKKIDGLLGIGYIPFPLTCDGEVVNFNYEGYVIEDSSSAHGRACLHGKLYLEGDIVASGLAQELSSFAPIQNHNFDPALLKTDIMTAADSFNPDHGDLFVPEDMLERFHRRDSNGDLLKPVFRQKRMVLMGPMGVGKSSLFNRLTNSATPVSDMTETCTTMNSSANALGPAKELIVCDTPGTAGSDTNGMTVEQALQLRKALITGEVSQVVVVIAATNNPRAQAYCDQLEPLKGIFDCNTFRQDVDGTDVVMSGKRSSPRRTRPFVVVTHRDKIAANARVKTREIIDKIRKDYPWVGPVAFIDEDVSLGWLYNTIIACAGYEGENLTNYSIPIVEMFSQFKISFPPIKDEWMEIIESAKCELNQGMTCVEHQLKQVERLKITDGTVGGNYVDRVAPTLDCIMRFIDDIYEKTTLETLAKCYDTNIDDLWLDYQNEDLLNERFNTLNTIKKDLASILIRARRRVLSVFPNSGESAVYKKCNNPKCSQVYMKPTGCNYLGRCGLLAGVQRDESHNGTMNLAIQYEYKWNDNVATSLRLSEGKKTGVYESFVLGLRRATRTVARYLPINQRSEYLDEPHGSMTTEDLRKAEQADKKYGCGMELSWSKMIPLSGKELEDKGLVPDTSKIASYEPVADITSMKIETFLVEKCGEKFEEYAAEFKSNGLSTMKDVLEVYAELGGSVFEDMIQKVLHRKMFLMRLKEQRN